MSDQRRFPENLGVRARAGALESSEQVEFERLLEASPTLRLAHDVGCDFDRVAAVQAGDEERVARIVRRTLAESRRRHPRRPLRGRISPWMLAAAVLGFCGVAFGVYSVWVPVSDRRKDPSAVSAKSTAGLPRALVAATARSSTDGAAESATQQASRPLPPTASSRRNTTDEERPAVPAISRQSLGSPQSTTSEPASVVPIARSADSTTFVPGTDAKTPEPSPANEGRTLTTTNEPSSSAPPTAMVGAREFLAPGAANVPEPRPPLEGVSPGLLLQQANAARTAGQVDRAIAGLSELQRRFPSSPEAHLSRVSSGKLLMQRGLYPQALQQFSLYLTTGGPLEEEAYLGRARALAALGQHEAERRTWQQLLLRHPASIYANSARERLLSLDQGTAR